MMYEEDGDDVPLIGGAAMGGDNDDLSRKKVSFEIATMHQQYHPILRSRVVACAVCIVTLLAFGSLIRHGFSRSPKPMTTQVPAPETCIQRFNMTYEDLLDRLANQEPTEESSPFCSPERPRCPCKKPFVPLRQDWKDEKMLGKWDRKFERNKANAEIEKSYDVVFYGDSITEHWGGVDLGTEYAKLVGAHVAYNRFFNISNGAPIDGLTLGIGGDRVSRSFSQNRQRSYCLTTMIRSAQCPQLLYRLQNGELPDTLQAKIFWVLIGTNDFGADHCSIESILAGNIQIVEEIRRRRPTSTVVINSILPRGNPGTDIMADGRSWPTLTTVNRWLECYANENDNIEFFNATDIFMQPYPNETMTVKEYYDDPVHPSPAGHLAWAEAMVEWMRDFLG